VSNQLRQQPELCATRTLHPINDPASTIEVRVYTPRSVPNRRGEKGPEWRCDCEIRCAPQIAAEADQTFHLHQPDSLAALVGVLSALRYRLDKIAEQLGSELVATPRSVPSGPGVPYIVPMLLGEKFEREMEATIVRELRAFIDREPDYMEALRKEYDEDEERTEDEEEE